MTTTLDELKDLNLVIRQPEKGYRFSVDPLLLCDFAVTPEMPEKIIDLGTGCGVIPLVMARRYPESSITGLELQESMANLAKENVETNGLQKRVYITFADILDSSSLFPVGSFDLVVSNPPYRQKGTGRISPRTGRDLARHESSAGLGDFLDAGFYLCGANGRICLIYHVSRLAECITEAARRRLFMNRLKCVHGTPGAPAKMAMIEFRKIRRGELVVEPPVIVHE